MMMRRSKWIPILTIALLAQAALAAGLAFHRDDGGAFRSEDPLLAFDTEGVDELRIAEGDEATVVLRKDDGTWTLPDHHAFPADAEAVDHLLERLAGLERGWPVATTEGAAPRFKVAEEAYERRIALAAAGETLGELFIGTSPGFRKVHVRASGSDEIHAVAFSFHEAAAKPADWIDRDVLKREKGELVRVEMGDIVLERDGDEWTLTDLPEDHEPVAGKVRSLLDKLTTLRVDSVLGREAKAEYRQDAPVVRATLVPEVGPPVTYTISQPEGETHYVIKASDREHYMKLPSYAVDGITEVARTELFQAKVSEAASAGSEAAEGEGEGEADGEPIGSG